jgi:hypothetical protein
MRTDHGIYPWGSVDDGKYDGEVFCLKKEVKDLSVKLNQVIGEVAKLTKQTSVPGILQEVACTRSTLDSLSGHINSSESVVPVYIFW